jgi:hypothetical protein
MNAVRRLAYRTFEHMHQLAALPSRAKDRRIDPRLGARRNAIEIIVRMVIMQLADDRAPPDHRRAALSVRLALRRGHHGDRHLLHGFTYFATEWRINIRGK